MTGNAIYPQIINLLISALNKLSLYPSDHPLVKGIISDAHQALSKALALKKELTFSISGQDKILVEGEPITSSAQTLLEEFVAEFKKLQAESITFCEGIPKEELEQFLKMMLSKSDDLKKGTEVAGVLAKNGITHIKVNLFSFVKVEKDKEVIAQKKGKVIGSEEFTLQLKGILEGSLDDASEITKALEAFGNYLIQEAKDKDAKAKLDIAKSANKSFLQLKKLTSLVKDKNKLETVKSLLDEKTNQYLDKVLIEAIILEYLKKKNWSALIRDIFKRFYPREDEVKRIMPELENKFSQAGIAESDRKSFMLEMEKGLSLLTQPQPTKIDKKELSDLKEENSRLKSDLEKLQNELRNLEGLKKKSKEAINEKERVENIIHHMAEGLVVVDQQGKILLMNPAAEKLLSATKEELAGKLLRERIKDEHLLTLSKELKPDAEGNLTKEIELFSPDDSTKRVLKTSSAVVENQDGKAVGMVTVLNDITRQKEIEKLKSDFVANVSHELRTPLVVIQQSLSILSGEVKDKLNEDQKRFFSNAQNNLNRLRHLINDLLDMASIEAGKLKLKPAVYDINELVQNLSEFLNGLAKAKNITLETLLLPDKTELYIDKDRITQVITNLVGNAVKFTPEGGRISIALKERPPDQRFSGQAIEVSVTDTGSGIDEKDLERIFEKFEQAGASVVTNSAGTGLGLSIAKEIIQMHGGQIHVESEIGEGSKFVFFIPLNKKEAKDG